MSRYLKNRKLLEADAKHWKAISRLRPTIIASPLIRLLDKRRIIEVEGLKLFISPFSHLGTSVINDGTYEPDTVRIFREFVTVGDAVVDIGANEGFFSALSAEIVGPNGLVIAVEPQSRLGDLIDINFSLNSNCPRMIIDRAVGEQEGETMELNLFPISNTGGSSLVRKYVLGARKEKVTTITLEQILTLSGRDQIDFVKVDVEGFEAEVINSMVPLLERGAIRHALVDYHCEILKKRRLDPKHLDALIRSRNYRAVEGEFASGFVLYERGTPGPT